MAAMPERCALAGFSEASGARVVARHQVDDYAAVYVMANDGVQGDLLVIARREGETWTEQCSGGAAWTWVAFPDEGSEDSDLGVLALVGDLAEPGTVEVQLDGRALSHGRSALLGCRVRRRLCRLAVPRPSSKPALITTRC